MPPMSDDHREVVPGEVPEVPSWDGDPKTWRHYRRKALQYQECTEREDRYLCGPRLVARLACPSSERGGTLRAGVAVQPGWSREAHGLA